jgi:hypothetical protein
MSPHSVDVKGVIHVYQAQSLTVYYTIDGVVNPIVLNPGDNYILSAQVLDSLIDHPTLSCLEGCKILGISDWRALDIAENNEVGLEVAIEGLDETGKPKQKPISVVGDDGKAQIQKAAIKGK